MELVEMIAEEFLASMESEDILQVVCSKEEKTKNQEVTEAWEKAENNTRGIPKNVILMIPEIKILDIHEPFYDKKGEIYVIAQVSSAILDDEKQSYTKHTTQQFHEIKKGDSLGLGRNGMVIWAGDVSGDKVNGKDPKEFIDFHIAVMESDKKSRDLAADLEKFGVKAKLDEIDKIVKGLSVIDPTQLTNIVSLSKLAFDLLITGLKNDKDDVVGTFEDTLLRQQNYNPGRFPNNPSELYKAGDMELAYNVVIS